MKNFIVLSVLLLSACGSKAPNTTTTTSGGGTPAADAPALNGCTTFKDMSGSAAWTIPWDPSLASSELRCVKIKVQQTVAFSGNHTTYPLKAAGGTTPTPLANVADAMSNPGTEQEGSNFLFTAPGTYGYASETEPTMTGAILVEP